MKRNKIGDIFVATLSNNKKKYFQFITLDFTQLNFEVIRVFDTFYNIDESPDMGEIINEES